MVKACRDEIINKVGICMMYIWLNVLFHNTIPVT
jgi:hypothetical protein